MGVWVPHPTNDSGLRLRRRDLRRLQNKHLKGTPIIYK